MDEEEKREWIHKRILKNKVHSVSPEKHDHED
jgi:hypothetical protein